MAATKRAAARRATTPAPAKVVELDSKFYDEADAARDAELAAGFDDWDAYWAARNPVRPARIRGVMVTPPTDASLELIRDVENVVASSDMDDLKRAVRLVFGQDILDTWIVNGMGMREIQCVLAWAGASMRGKPVGFDEAVALVEQALQDAGKAPNRAARRATKATPSRRRSAGTGG